MKAKILIVSFISFFMGISWYNSSLEKLQTLFETKNSDFFKEWDKISKYNSFQEDEALHKLNVISFMLQSPNIDSLKLQKIQQYLGSNKIQEDSLLAILAIQTEAHDLYKLQSSFSLNQNLYGKEKIDRLERILKRLKIDFQRFPNNIILRHNYYVLSKYFEKNHYYHDLLNQINGLIKEQLNQDIKFYKSDIFQSVEKQIVLSNKKEKETLIYAQRQNFESDLVKMIRKTLGDDLFKTSRDAAIDSVYESKKISKKLFEKLRMEKNKSNISKEFFQNEYPDLFNETYRASIQKTIEHETLQDSIQKIVCKYFPNTCDSKKPNFEKDITSSNKKPNGTNQAEQAIQKAIEEKEDGLKQENSKNSVTRKSEESDSDKMKQGEGQKTQNNVQKQGSSSKISKNDALQTLKKMDEATRNYHKQKMERTFPETGNGEKPDW